MAVDLLVFAAHPDDAEMACGGLIAKLVQRGYQAGVIDLSRGEMGSRGTPEIRRRESEAASAILGLALRENLGLPDAGLTDSLEARQQVVEAIRRHRPSLVVAPACDDVHPDHGAVGRLVRAAFYPAGFARYVTGSAPYRPLGLIHYLGHLVFEPSFVVDVSAVWEIRMQAVRAYASQLFQPESDEPATTIADAGFLDRLAARFRHFGSLIGVDYGEPYLTAGPVPLPDPIAAFGGPAPG